MRSKYVSYQKSIKYRKINNRNKQEIMTMSMKMVDGEKSFS